MIQSQPIFQTIFGTSWDSLPPVMHKHYANRPYSNDIVTATGKMEVKFGCLIRLLSPFIRMLGVLVPYQGKDIPVTVRFRSKPDANIFCLDRTFNFPDKKPYHFFSELTPVENDVMIEFMRYGIGWKHRFYFDGKKVILEHRGYVWKIFDVTLPIPFGALLGHGYAEEEALNSTNFRMKMNITHPLFGKMYEYSGIFEIIDD